MQFRNHSTLCTWNVSLQKGELSKPGPEHLGHPWPSCARLHDGKLHHFWPRPWSDWCTARFMPGTLRRPGIGRCLRWILSDPTFQGQALVCIIAMILLFTYIYIYMTYIYTSSSSSLRGIRSCHVLSFKSVGWTPSQALRLQAEQAQEALAQRLGLSMVVEHSVDLPW